MHARTTRAPGQPTAPTPRHTTGRTAAPSTRHPLPLLRASASNYEVVADKATLPIATPLLADRQTRKLHLANGMNVYLVSDPGIEESAASLTVRAGSWQDPDEYPGTAHFLEHMLFMGTEKFPDEAEYERYLTQHGGTFNAYTAGDHTMYGFSCKNAGFAGAIERFSGFFTEPLLKPSCLERERNAVDQEFSGYKEVDGRRAHEVRTRLSNPNHPASRFTIGNQETLGKLDAATLRAWYEQHYSANLMHLVLYSPLPLQQLEELAVEHFAPVPNRQLEPFKVDQPTTNPANEGQLVYIASKTKSGPSLTLDWDIPPSDVLNQQTTPAQVIAYVLNHGGANSLQTLLKERGLARAVGASPNYALTGSATFTLYVALTDEGIQRRDEVTQLCFAALNQLREKGVPEYIFDEMRQSGLRAHMFQSRSSAYDTAQQHGQGLLQEDLATYPDRSVAPESYDAAAITAALSRLQPARCQFTLTAHPDLARLPANLAEHWMDTRYSVRPVPAETLAAWSAATAPTAAFPLPPPNRFIPQNLQLVPIDDNSPKASRPLLLVDDERATIYFARDVRERTPEVAWTFDIKTPSLDTPSPRTAVIRDIYLRMISDELSQTVATANMAGLDAGVSSSEGGIRVRVQGFGDKASVLLDDTLQALKKTTLSLAKFKEVTGSLANAYHDARIVDPQGVANEQLNTVRSTQVITQAQRARALESIKLMDVVQFGRRLFDSTYVQASLMGNMSPAHVESVQRCLETHLNGEPYAEGRIKHNHLRPLPTAPVRIDYQAECNDSLVLLTLEQGHFEFARAAAQDLLTQAISQRFFDELRTKQQTGYQVGAFSNTIDDVVYSHFLVKPHHHANGDVLARIEQFIEAFTNELGHSQVTEAEFDMLKQAKLAAITAPPRTMVDEGSRMHALAFEHKRDFRFVEKRAAAIANLSYQDFLKYSKSALGPQNTQRLAILVNGKLPPVGAPVYTTVGSAGELLTKVNQAV